MRFDYVIEKQWVTKEGFLATIVFFARDGARRGYISLPEGHKLERVKYDDPILDNINIHWGLTFSQYANLSYIPNKVYWTFGFDCVHAGDLPDANAYTKNFQDRPIPNHIVDYLDTFKRYKYKTRTLLYVEEQLNNLSVQLSKITEGE